MNGPDRNETFDATVNAINNLTNIRHEHPGIGFQVIVLVALYMLAICRNVNQFPSAAILAACFYMAAIPAGPCISFRDAFVLLGVCSILYTAHFIYCMI